MGHRVGCRKGSSPATFLRRNTRALAGGLIEQDAAGNSSVEAFDRAGAGNGDGAIGLRDKIGGNAIAFVADDYCYEAL